MSTRDPSAKKHHPEHCPSVDNLLRFFKFAHLPPHLQEVSKDFCVLAYAMAKNPRAGGSELTVCLRKLLEAKDCAVRSVL